MLSFEQRAELGVVSVSGLANSCQAILPMPIYQMLNGKDNDDDIAIAYGDEELYEM